MEIKALSKEQMTRLLEVARQQSTRDYIMIAVGYQLGLRATEICSLTAGQFDVCIDKIYCTVQRLKGSRKTTQELANGVVPLIRELIAGKRPDEYLFTGNVRTTGSHIGYTTFYQAFLKYCRLADIPQHLQTPPVLKHSAGMAIVRSGAGVEAVQKHLGHKNLSSSGHYIELCQAEVDAIAHKALALAGGL